MCIRRTPVSGVTKSSTTINTRKRVRFEQAEESEHKAKRRTIIDYRPLCKELTLEEKRNGWLQADERANIAQDCKQVAQDSRTKDKSMIQKGQVHFAFSETYTNVYAVCHLSDMKDSSDICSVLSREVVTFMALKNESARGLEDWTVPHVALERRVERKKVIRAVLQGQKARVDTEKLCQVSQALSRPACKLAQAVGAADATSAMLEYKTMVEDIKTSSAPSSQEESSHVQHSTRTTEHESCSPIMAVASS